MIGNRLTLLLDDDLSEMEATARELHALLPGMDVDR